MKRKPGLGRGVLHAEHGQRAFAVKRFEPSAALSPYVEHIWTVRWDRQGLKPFTQVNLPDPAVHLSFETSGTTPATAMLLGPSAGKFVKVLSGWGHVFAAKFRPGGLRRIWDGSVSDLREQAHPAAALFGPSVHSLAQTLLDKGPRFHAPSSHSALDAESASGLTDAESASGLADAENAGVPTDAKSESGLTDTESASGLSDAERAAVLDAGLCRWAQFPVDRAELELVQRVCEALQCDRSLLTVKDAAAREGVSVRTLQRLFHQSVGYAPKWVLQRGRLQDAASRLANTDASVTSIAHALGFSDAAHFARAFKTLTGLAPTQFRSDARRLGASVHPGS